VPVPFLALKDLEIDFTKRLAEVTADVSVSPLLESGESKETDQIYALADISPASASIEACRRVEQAAEDKVRQFLPKGETYKDPLRRPVDYLDFKGALIPSTASAARDLRVLRNEAVHAGANEISREDALQYATVARQIRMQIESVTELPTVKLTALTLLILKLNHLIDSKKYEVMNHRRRSVLRTPAY